MPAGFDGSGNFNRVYNWQSDASASIKILASRHDDEDNNFAQGLSRVITRDGQSPPTADLPMGGKKLVNLGPPSNPTDSATKGYADSIRSFNTAINLSGAVPEARIGFTQADIGFGARVAGTPAGSVNRFVWNDKPDLSGVDVAVMYEDGRMVLGPITLPAPANYRSILTVANDITVADNAAAVFNGYYDTPGATFKALAAGYVGYLHFAPGSGTWALTTSAASATKDAPVSMAGALSISAAGNATFKGSVTAESDPNIWLGKSGGSNVVNLGAGASLAWSGAVWTLYGGGLNVSGGLNAAGPVTSDGNFLTTVTSWIGAPGIAGVCYFRPGGQGVTATQHYFSTGGVNFTGTLTISGATATKSTGTTWANPSDARIKEVVGDYETGLAEIMQITPRRFTYKGNDTPLAPGIYEGDDPEMTVAKEAQAVPYESSPHYQMALDGTEVAGFVAQEIEAVMPAMVTQTTGYIDGEEVADFRVLDTTNLTYALVNAVKELADRVEQLEAA